MTFTPIKLGRLSETPYYKVSPPAAGSLTWIKERQERCVILTLKGWK